MSAEFFRLLVVIIPQVTNEVKGSEKDRRQLLRSSPDQDDSRLVNDNGSQTTRFVHAIYGDAFVGCYDASSGSLTMEHQSNVPLKLDNCLLYCVSQDFDFAGLQNKDDCYCGSLSDGLADLEEECDNADCKAYEKCVGPEHLAVFATKRLLVAQRRTSWLGQFFGIEDGATASPSAMMSTTMSPTKFGSFDQSMEGSSGGGEDNRPQSTPSPTMDYTFDSSGEDGAGEDEGDSDIDEADSPTSGPTEDPGEGGGIFDLSNGPLGELFDNFFSENDPYIGCFVDILALPAMPFVSHSFHNVDTCREYCGEKNFHYAGLEGSTKCFCGNFYSKYGPAVTDDECNLPCKLGNKGVCGGMERLSVYHALPQTMSPTTAPTTSPTKIALDDGASSGYIGCYKDHPHVPAMRHKSDDDHNIESCIEYCLEKNYEYAGLSNARDCYCGNTYDAYGIAGSDIECNMVCDGGSGICGGHGRLSVYAVSEEFEERRL